MYAPTHTYTRTHIFISLSCIREKEREREGERYACMDSVFKNLFSHLTSKSHEIFFFFLNRLTLILCIKTTKKENTVGVNIFYRHYTPSEDERRNKQRKVRERKDASKMKAEFKMKEGGKKARNGKDESPHNSGE